MRIIDKIVSIQLRGASKYHITGSLCPASQRCLEAQQGYQESSVECLVPQRVIERQDMGISASKRYKRVYMHMNL